MALNDHDVSFYIHKHISTVVCCMTNHHHIENNRSIDEVVDLYVDLFFLAVSYIYFLIFTVKQIPKHRERVA